MGEYVSTHTLVRHYSVQCGGRRRTGHYNLKIIILLPQTPAYARAGGTAGAYTRVLRLTHVLTARAYARAYGWGLRTCLGLRTKHALDYAHTHRLRLTAGAYTRVLRLTHVLTARAYARA